MKAIIIILVMILVGCSNGGGNNFSPTPTPLPTSTPAQSPLTSQSAPVKKVENQVISTYSTKLVDKKKSRLKNIEKAIGEVNKVVVQPGETFSFNQTVGPRTAKRGYEKALIILKKEKVLDYGGGVCQVSTTIYNAALSANLEIVERHQHEKEVGYVKLGDDATVSYGSLDLKIKNNKDYPIKFRLSLGKNTVDASIITAY